MISTPAARRQTRLEKVWLPLGYGQCKTFPVEHGHMSDTGPWDIEVDARGLLCPLPVLRARKKLLSMHQGQTLRLLATDPAAIVDVPHFCHEAGHSLIGTAETSDATVYLIRRG